MYTKRYYKILLIFIIPTFFASAQRKTDSQAKLINSVSLRPKTELCRKTGASFKNTHMDSVLHYDSLALKKSIISRDISAQAETLLDFGQNSFLLGNNKKSLVFSRQALSLFSIIKDKKGMAASLYMMGTDYQNFGQYEEALRSLLTALEYYEELNDYKGIIITYNQLGIFYKDLKEYAKAQNYYNQALKILRKNPEDELLAKTYNNIGNLYMVLGDYKASLKYNLESLKIKKTINSGPVELVNSYLSMGNVFRKLKQYRAAEEQYKLGLSISRRVGSKNHQALLFRNMGILYEKTGQFNKALKFHRQSIQLAQNINFNKTILDNLLGFSRIYKKLGRYKLALRYYKKYQNDKDSVFNTELKYKLDNYRNQYEAVRKAKEIQHLTAAKQQSISALLIAAFILIILLIIVIITRYRTKIKTNSELLDKNTEVADLLTKLNNLNSNLSDSESTYRYLFDRNPAAMFILEDETFNILAVNNSAIEQYGFKEDEFLEMTFKYLWDKENRESFYDFQACMLGSPGKVTEATHVTKDGRRISVEIVGRPLTFDGKKALYVMTSDETERKLIEQIVQESEERFRNLFEGAPDAIILVDAEKEKILDANPAATKLFQMTKEKILLLKHRDIYPKDKYETVENIFAGLSLINGSNENNDTVEIEIERPDGTKVPVEISSNITSISGEPVIQCILREISLRKITEAALVQSEQRLRKAQTIANVGNWEIDLKTGNVYGSEESAIIYGFEKYLKIIPFEEIKSLAHPDDRKPLDKAMHELITNGKEFNEKFRIRKKNSGELRILEARAELVLDENNIPVKVLGAIRDITELNNFQEQLILARKKAERSNKLKSDFLAQMSHEIRSPVNIIMSYASLIKEELNNKVNEEIRSCFCSIDNGGKRLIRTIDLILNMADIQSGKYETFMEHTDLEKDILEKIISEYAPAAESKGLNLRFTNELGSKKIMIDRYTVTQIFSNLVDNAIKYTKEGEILVSLQGDKDYITVIVKDTGIGISDEYMPHIFDPFSQEDQGYTRRFEGTGLGLSLVKKYCDINGAKIFVESEKGTGTVFKIKFKFETENLFLASYSNM